MPSRILKESICTSSEIDGLSPEEEVFFYRLLVNADDWGRFDGRPEVIRAKCFPLRTDSITTLTISKWLNSLFRLDLINIYVIDTRPYLSLCTWDKHQRIRAKRSKYPSPNGTSPTTQYAACIFCHITFLPTTPGQATCDDCLEKGKTATPDAPKSSDSGVSSTIPPKPRRKARK